MAKRKGFDLGAAVVNKERPNVQHSHNVQHSNKVQQDISAKRKTMWFTAEDRALLDELKRQLIMERGDNVSEIEVVRAGLLALKAQRH